MQIEYRDVTVTEEQHADILEALEVFEAAGFDRAVVEMKDGKPHIDVIKVVQSTFRSVNTTI